MLLPVLLLGQIFWILFSCFCRQKLLVPVGVAEDAALVVSVAADIAGSPAGTTSLAAAWVSVVGDAGAAAELFLPPVTMMTTEHSNRPASASLILLS